MKPTGARTGPKSQAAPKVEPSSSGNTAARRLSSVLPMPHSW